MYAHGQANCILPKSFFEGRFIPDFHPESLDYEQWWEEQLRRCDEGWSDGGYQVSDVMYYHLNFKKINLELNGRPSIDFPFFSFEDQELFNCVKTARDNGKGLMLITGRGFGKSFDAATIAEKEFTFNYASEIIVSSSIDEFVKKLWEKINLGLSTQPPEIRQNLLKWGDTLVSGEKIFENGKERQDVFSIMRKIIYDKDPGKTRGSRPNIHIFEEVGSWSAAAKLKDCYKKTEPSWWRGAKFMCFPFLIGTGGEMDTGASEDAKEMFWNPEAFNLMAFEYKDQKIGKFFPAYRKFGTFYEDTGISRDQDAKDYLDKRRASKRLDDDMYKQETMEFPFSPEEAFQTKGDSIFTTELLENRLVTIMRDRNEQKIERGHLHWVKEGSKVIGVRWEQDDKGVFEIAEHPVWTRQGWTEGKIVDLYVSGIDSFDAVLENNDELAKRRRSSGSHFVLKRFWRPSEVGPLFVAKFTQRTNDASEFYDNTVKLNLYYNSKALIEYTMKGIFSHYINAGFEYLLYKRPRLDSTVVKESHTTNTYGIAMPDEVKLYVVKLLARYTKQYTDYMYHISLIKQCLEFRFGSSAFDEVMAAAIACLANEDMVKVAIREEKKKAISWPKYVRDSRGRLVFK